MSFYRKRFRKHYLSFLLVVQLEHISSVTRRISAPPGVLHNTGTNQNEVCMMTDAARETQESLVSTDENSHCGLKEAH